MNVSNKKCKKNSDCKSNLCELIHENNVPKGRFCIDSNNVFWGKYHQKADKNTPTNSISDCYSGIYERYYSINNLMLIKTLFWGNRIPINRLKIELFCLISIYSLFI